MHENTGWLDLWPGFHVTDSRITNDSAWLPLEPLTRLTLRCGHCLGLVDSVHERVTRNVRDLPLAGRVLTRQVQLLRVNCTRCGHCLQHVRWFDRFARMTRAMAQTVALRFMDAAKLLGAWVDDGRGVPSVWDYRLGMIYS